MTDFSRASSLALFNEYCLQSGLDSTNMLKAARLPADTLANPESLIPYSRFLNLLDLCAEKSGNPLFGLEYALYQGVAIFGPLFYLIRNARTVGESLQELAMGVACRLLQSLLGRHWARPTKPCTDSCASTLLKTWSN